MILALAGSIIVIVGLGEGKWGPAAIGAVMILVGILFISASHEESQARINRRRYWAHYYDKDQVEARRRR